MRIRQLHQDLARLTREVGAYGGLDAEKGSIDGALFIVGRLRVVLDQFERAHRPAQHPLRVGDIVRYLLDTPLEHETRVTGLTTNDRGEFFAALESNPDRGCTIPYGQVRLVRRADESGPIEDAHGPVAGDPPGVTVLASVTRAELDELAKRTQDLEASIVDLDGHSAIQALRSGMQEQVDRLDRRFARVDTKAADLAGRIDQLAENVAKLVSVAAVARRDIGALVGRMNETDVRTIVDNHCDLPGEISAIAEHVEVIDDKVRKLEGEWHPIIAAVGHALGAEIARQQMKEDGT